MATASDPSLTEVTKKRPSSAPKPGHIAEIPQIILNERKQTPLSLPSSLSSSVHAGAFSCQGGCRVGVAEGAGKQGHVPGSHVLGKSSSDIGLPTSSMPNLSAMAGGDTSTNESYLEVFCSPRTFRRSVDFDINSKEHTRGHFVWVDVTESSTNSLKVLTTSSRVGSTLSLTSECTARSIGLLSNDSVDSDNDLSLTESEKLSSRPPHLRRFMSYPEDGVSSDLCARPSQSMSDIKVMDRTNVAAQVDSDAVLSVSLNADVTVTPDRQDPKHGADSYEPPNSGRMSSDRSSSSHDPRLQEKLIRAHKKEIYRDRSRGGTARSSHMLSYKCDTHDSVRDGRIRQWLQDMDSQS